MFHFTACVDYNVSCLKLMKLRAEEVQRSSGRNSSVKSELNNRHNKTKQSKSHYSNVNRLPKELWVWLCSHHPQPKIPPETMKVGAHLPRKWRTRLHNALGSDEKFGCVMRLMQQSFPISVGEWTRSPMVVTLKKETSVCCTWLTWTTWVSRAFSNNLSGR